VTIASRAAFTADRNLGLDIVRAAAIITVMICHDGNLRLCVGAVPIMATWENVLGLVPILPAAVQVQRAAVVRRAGAADRGVVRRRSHHAPDVPGPGALD
jgi:hypothetical protein